MRQKTSDHTGVTAPPGDDMQGRAEPLHLLCEAGELWLRDRRSAVKQSTYVKYETIWRCHILPALGSARITSVDGRTVGAFTQALLAEGLAVKTVRDILAALRSVLAYAAAMGWTAGGELRFCYPKQPRRPVRVLSRQEQDRFVRYLSQDMDCCRFGILLALLTGMRLGELCALRWGNISRTERTIFIDATMQRLRVLDGGGSGRTQVVIGSPKSAAAVRVIPLSDHAAALCGRMGAYGPECYVLTGTERFMEPRAVQFRLKKYTKDCGLDGVHFHTLRHTFATRGVEVGFELKSLSEVLGHANTTITLDLYVHASMDLKRRNMNKLTQAGL